MSAPRITMVRILNILDVPHLSLYEGPGYYYFVYDDVDADVYQTRSVMVYRLNHMTLDQWVQEGRSFVNEIRRAAA